MATNGKYDFVQQFYTKREGKMRMCDWQLVRFGKTTGWTTRLDANVAGGYATNAENLETTRGFDRLQEWDGGKAWMDFGDGEPRIQIHGFRELPFNYTRGQ